MAIKRVIVDRGNIFAKAFLTGGPAAVGANMSELFFREPNSPSGPVLMSESGRTDIFEHELLQPRVVVPALGIALLLWFVLK